MERRRSFPVACADSATEKHGPILSLGCAGSLDRYVSLKSKYRTIIPLTNAASSGVVFFRVPKRVEPLLSRAASATFREILTGSAVKAPIAQPRLSTIRFLVS